MSKNPAVLIVDDEKNIRISLSRALESSDIKTDTAVDGEEALSKLKDEDYNLVLLDLKLPGIQGMEVLRKIRESRPDIHIIIITAYGTIDSAVEAMKLGAVDYIQKPFSPEEIRELVSNVLKRKGLDAEKAKDYNSFIQLAKRSIEETQFNASIEWVKKAISLEPERPEAMDLLGTLQEIKGNEKEAMKNYRAALSLDPTYKQAKKNLSRLTGA